METTLLEQPKRPLTRRFQWLFFSALLTCTGIIVCSLWYRRHVVREEGSWNFHGLIQTIGVIFFAFSAWAIVYSRTQAKNIDFNRPGILIAIEKKVLVTSPLLASSLIWFAAIIFSVLMSNREEIAIFFMAVVSIYVAVEHWDNLHAQHELLEVYKRTLGNLASNIDAQHELLEKYEKKLGSLANASGLEKGREELYRAYRLSSKKIVAVVRSFDIDIEWFNSDGKKDSYMKMHRPETFYNALKNGIGALFVSDLPLPYFKVDHTSFGHVDYANQFNNLLGLAWQWCRLEDIRVACENNGNPCEFEIKIGPTSNWIHVANNRVYQLIQGRVPRESKVRDLTFDLSEGDDLLTSLRSWAVREIKDAADGGCSGVEFLCTTILSHPATAEFKETAWLTRQSLVRILDDLGMEEWLAKKADYVEGLTTDNSRISELCVEIFEEFLEVVTRNKGQELLSYEEKTAKISKDPYRKICLIQDIAHEVL